MSIDPTPVRADESWQNGYRAGRTAALAELDTARTEIEQLHGRLRRAADLLAEAEAGDRAAPGPVVFGHTYLVREAGDGMS